MADIDLDGRDDIVTFLGGQGAARSRARELRRPFDGQQIPAQRDAGERFRRARTLPFIGHFTKATLDAITGRPEDATRRFPDLVAFRTTERSM